MQTAQLIDSFPLQLDPRLMEEAVMLHMNGHLQEDEFRRARDRIYELSDEEERHNQFDQFHQQWFTRLNLRHSLIKALGEHPLLMRETGGCRVGRAVFPKEEGADLYGASPMTVVLKLRPESLLDHSALLAFLRHEFTHLTDMLDPCFNYEVELPKSEIGPSYDNVIRERYRVLWDTWIDGRLLHRGWAGEEARLQRLAEFRATFQMLGESAHTKFLEWFESPFHTHKEMVAFASHPETTVHSDQTSRQDRTGRCSLCRFPSFDLQNGRELPLQAVREIGLDFPSWRPHQGLCRQCADLYQSRSLSQSAEAALPRT
jgi:hypothetical protein